MPPFATAVESDPVLTGLRDALAAASRDAKERYAAFKTLRDELVSEHGAEKVASDTRLFAEVEGRRREYDEAASKAEGLQARLLERLGAKGAGIKQAALDVTAGGTLPFHDSRDGIYALPQRPTLVSDLVPQEQTDSEETHFMRETVYTNQAAPVAPGAVKPTTTISIERATARVSPVAHVSEAFDRFLVRDVANLDPFLRARMVLGVALSLDNQLLNGSGAYPQLRGILNTAGIQTQALGADDRPTAVHKAITLIRLQEAEPDAVLLSPNDWQDIVLMKNAAGDYIYGNPGDPDVAQRIWQLPVVVTTALAAGTALVGNFRQGCQLWQRDAIEVDVAEQGLGNAAGEEMFGRDQVRLRGEGRFSFATIRPALFATVTAI